uniref:Uncharacterized protein n=1 Tax=Heterorhabditis bacteriophora TaxID=37862 RepID=A0A1I7W945_HETBA
MKIHVSSLLRIFVTSGDSKSSRLFPPIHASVCLSTWDAESTCIALPFSLIHIAHFFLKKME